MIKNDKIKGDGFTYFCITQKTKTNLRHSKYYNTNICIAKREVSVLCAINIKGFIKREYFVLLTKLNA